MSFFTSGTFWLIEGIFLCLAVIGFKFWSEDRGLAMPPWKWALAFGWFFFVGFTLAFVGTCLGEGEPAAALRGGSVLVVLAGVSGFFVWRALGFFQKKRA